MPISGKRPGGKGENRKAFSFGGRRPHEEPFQISDFKIEANAWRRRACVCKRKRLEEIRVRAIGLLPAGGGHPLGAAASPPLLLPPPTGSGGVPAAASPAKGWRLESRHSQSAPSPPLLLPPPTGSGGVPAAASPAKGWRLESRHSQSAPSPPLLLPPPTGSGGVPAAASPAKGWRLESRHSQSRHCPFWKSAVSRWISFPLEPGSGRTALWGIPRAHP